MVKQEFQVEIFENIYGMNFIDYCFSQTNIVKLKPQIMSRQNRNSVRDRKTDDSKRDVANSNERYTRNNREESRNGQDRGQMSPVIELDRYRLNDLYERSSI